MRAPLIVIMCLLICLSPVAAGQSRERIVDVAVFGGTAGGVIAAVAAAREGKSVLLLEPGKHIGGMVSGGLGATDVGNAGAIGGYSREFFDRVQAYYLAKYGPKSQQAKDAAGGFRFEPHVAEKIFHDMIGEAKVLVLFDQRLSKAAMEARSIRSITMQSGLQVHAAVFIDASYEGDLMAMAKVSYAIGREGRDQYGESIAGVQKHSPAHQ